MEPILHLAGRKAQIESQAQAEILELKALLRKSRQARRKAEHLIAESRALLEQAQRRERMARQAVRGFSDEECEALDELAAMEAPPAFRLTRDDSA
jgi:vacuolar-type H+-ATPase subunit E/Vma4